jgi:hypothetical protein
VGRGVRPLHRGGDGGHDTGIWTPDLGQLVTPLLREIIEVLVVFRVDHVLDVSGHFPEKQTRMASSRDSGFRAMSWSIRTAGLLDPPALVVQQSGSPLLCKVPWERSKSRRCFRLYKLKLWFNFFIN